MSIISNDFAWMPCPSVYRAPLYRRDLKILSGLVIVTECSKVFPALPWPGGVERLARGTAARGSLLCFSPVRSASPGRGGDRSGGHSWVSHSYIVTLSHCHSVTQSQSFSPTGTQWYPGQFTKILSLIQNTLYFTGRKISYFIIPQTLTVHT